MHLFQERKANMSDTNPSLTTENFNVDKLAVIHEAGHAAVAFFLGFPSGRVELYRFQNGAQLDPGATVYGVWEDASLIKPIDAVFYLLAGTVAERYLIENENICPDLSERKLLRALHQKQDKIRSNGDREKAFLHATNHGIQNASSMFDYENQFISTTLQILECDVKHTIEIYNALFATGQFSWEGNS
jgi:hypothetical protein